MVTLNVLDVNEKPEIDPPETITYAENQQFTTAVLGKISASDPDASDPADSLTYEIVGGNDNEWFAINSDGEFTLTEKGIGLPVGTFISKTASNDFETNPNGFILQVVARDDQGATSKQVDVNLQVEDATEQVIVSREIEITEAGQLITQDLRGTIMGDSFQKNGQLMIKLEGDYSSFFGEGPEETVEVTIDSENNGILTLGNDFNFEGDGVINNTVDGLTLNSSKIDNTNTDYAIIEYTFDLSDDLLASIVADNRTTLGFQNSETVGASTNLVGDPGKITSMITYLADL